LIARIFLRSLKFFWAWFRRFDGSKKVHGGSLLAGANDWFWERLFARDISLYHSITLRAI